MQRAGPGLRMQLGVAKRQGECGRMTRVCGRGRTQAGLVQKTGAVCARSLLTTGKAITTVARQRTAAPHPQPGLPDPVFTDILKIKCPVIVTGQGDFSKVRMGNKHMLWSSHVPNSLHPRRTF